MYIHPDRRVELERRLVPLIEIELLTHTQAGARLGMSKSWVERTCSRIGIKTQRSGPRGGAGHPNWKGGRHTDRDGYVTIWLPEHPCARKSGRVLEHRLVMEATLGRLLDAQEVVHHIDGNRGNNVIENLQLFAGNGDHLRHELTGSVPNWTEKGCARLVKALERAAIVHHGKGFDDVTRTRVCARLKAAAGRKAPAGA